MKTQGATDESVRRWLAEEHEFEVITQNDPESSTFLLFIINVLPIVLFVIQ